MFIIGNYAPFFIIPLFMAIDGSYRLWKLVVEADIAEGDKKTQ